MVAAYLVFSGAARALVEIVRINDKVFLGLTQPQLWSLALITTGLILLAVDVRRAAAGHAPSTATGASAKGVDLSVADAR